MARSVAGEVPVRNLSVPILLVLSLLTILSLPALGQTCVPPPAGIIAWWPFDETSGTTAIDAVGGNAGTYAGAPQPAVGMVGGSLQFDGLGDYVVVPDSDLWAFGTTDFTIEFWANFDVLASGNVGHPRDVFISNDEGPFTVNKWFFGLSVSGLEFHVNGPGTGAIFSPIVPFSQQVGQWYHLALTRSDTSYTIYVDGTAAGSGVNTADVPNPNAVLTIGRAVEGSWDSYMRGRLDEMTVYHRLLSQADLQAIVAAGSAGKCKTLAIPTQQLSAAQVGASYSQQLEAIFGSTPLSWLVVAGTLPAGITLSTDGLLSGTPTQGGSFPFTVRVADSSNATAEKSFTLDVLLTLPPADIRIQKTGTLTVPGRNVDYFILVENTGSPSSSDVVVEEHLLSPALRTDLFNFVDGAPTPDFLEDGLVAVWVIPPIAPGASQLLTYRVRLSPSLPLGTQVVGGACRSNDGTADLSALRARMTDNSECMRQCVDICNQAYCGFLKDCLDSCEHVGWPLKKVCISACLIDFAECSGCLKGCTDACPAQTGEACPSGCACDQQNSTGPVDPNEKVVVVKTFIPPDQLLVYPIHFENVGQVKAQDVFVTDVLDPNLDLATVQFLTPTGASIDQQTRTVRWDLLGTNLPAGGSDNVLFSVRPLPGLPSGTEIRNTATIQFEVFTPLPTNEVVNIIDTTPPNCVMDPLPVSSATLTVPISWSGTDNVGEIESYSVFASTDGGPYVPFLENTQSTNASFAGVPGHSYGFICIAKDTAGNAEVQQPSAEATTAIQQAVAACIGDCNGDAEVTVDELLTMVNIALGNANVSACTPGDDNHDNEITIDEILTAVNHALTGCGSG
jgi:uncharacterized repeat protein (TIGR01451 family)